MGKPKLRPLPAILKLVESLSEDERADLRDYLRPAPKPRQKAKAAVCKIPNCGALIKSNIHDPEHSSFHHLPLAKPERKPSQKRKAEKEATAANDSECQVEGCGIPLIADRHHNKQNPNYHEFQPAGEASKGAVG